MNTHIESKEYLVESITSAILGFEFAGMGKKNSRKFSILIMLLVRMEYLMQPFLQKVEKSYGYLTAIYSTDDLEKIIFDQLEGLPFFKKNSSRVFDLLKQDKLNLYDVERYIQSFDTSTTSQLESFGYRELFIVFNSSYSKSECLKAIDRFEGIAELSDSDFLQLIYRSLYLYNSEADRVSSGIFYTSEPLSSLMAKLLLSNYKGNSIEIYDPNCGIGMPLLKANDIAKENSFDVSIFGQDRSNNSVNELIFKVAAGTKTTIERTDILLDDKMKGRKFKYILSDLPFGVRMPYIITNDYDINAKTDATMLFVNHIVDKLDTNGRAVFTLPQSQFSLSKPNKLLQELVEQDVLDAIVLLPSWAFAYTSFLTCLCVLDKNKSVERTNKVRILNIDSLFVCNGVDRHSFSEENIAQVLALYNSCEDNDFCRILSTKNLLRYNVSLVNNKGVEVTRVSVPAEEYDPIEYVNKNYISMMSDVEMNFDSIERTLSLDLDSLFLPKEDPIDIDELEIDVKNHLDKIKELSNQICSKTQPNYVAEAPVERYRKFAVTELANVRKSPIGRDASTTIDNGMPIISVPYLRNGIDPKLKYVQEPRAFVHVNDGDIVIINYGENAGEVMLAKEGYLSQSFYKVEVTGGVVKEYLYLYLKAKENSIRRMARGVAQKQLRKGDLLGFRILLPEMETQQRIVDKLRDKITSIDQLLPMLGGKVRETMINYRQALIADAIGRAND